MTKRDIIKWLELKRDQKKEEVNKKFIDAKDKLHNTLFEQLKTEEYAKKLNPLLTECQDLLKEYVSSAREAGCKTTYYSYCCLHDCITAIDRDNSVDYIASNLFNCLSLVDLDKKILEQRNISESQVVKNYTLVIANCRALPNAKECLEYLADLGFDVSEISGETKEITTLATPVDVNWLMLNKEEK